MDMFKAAVADDMERHNVEPDELLQTIFRRMERTNGEEGDNPLPPITKENSWEGIGRRYTVYHYLPVVSFWPEHTKI